ncbi:MAG: hypothetical protein NWE98_09170 [Candidatus Bathyarchaeota archaeon]|nr:hypothetical protein [Candidatus Bathyarchaeota archaeon]
MIGFSESDQSIRFTVLESSRELERSKLKPLTAGVQVMFCRFRGCQRWEIQAFLFDKAVFKNQQEARTFLDKHFKTEISSLLDYRAFNEKRRRLLNAWMKASELKQKG